MARPIKHIDLIRNDSSSFAIMSRRGWRWRAVFDVRTVRDSIEQHHGTDLYVFLRKGVGGQGGNARGFGVSIPLSGHLPQDKEMAIISLADACEGACRSLEKPSAAKIETVVDEISAPGCRRSSRRRYHVAELEKVRQSFISTLTA